MGLKWAVHSFNINSYHGVSLFTAGVTVHEWAVCNSYMFGMHFSTHHAEYTSEIQPENQTVFMEINDIIYPMPELQWL